MEIFGVKNKLLRSNLRDGERYNWNSIFYQENILYNEAKSRYDEIDCSEDHVLVKHDEIDLKHSREEQKSFSKNNAKENVSSVIKSRKTSVSINGLPVPIETLLSAESEGYNFVGIDIGESVQNDHATSKNTCEFKQDGGEVNKNLENDYIVTFDGLIDRIKDLETELSVIYVDTENTSKNLRKKDSLKLNEKNKVEEKEASISLSNKTFLNNSVDVIEKIDLSNEDEINKVRRIRSSPITSNDKFYLDVLKANEINNNFDENIASYETPLYVNLGTVKKQFDQEKENKDYLNNRFQRRRSLSEGENIFNTQRKEILNEDSLLKSLFKKTLSKSCDDILKDDYYYTDDDLSSNGGSDAEEIEELKKRTDTREKRNSFLGKSISVDLVYDDEGYFSSKTRRNGLNLDSNSEEDDFLTDLLHFKQLHQQKKKEKSPGLRFARSVENLLKIDKTSPRKRSNTDQEETRVKKHSKFLKYRFFSNKEKRMDYLRETCILDDEEELNNNNIPSKDNRPDISMIENSVQKVAGIIEMYVDKQGDVIRKIEITKVPGQSLGFFIRFGNGIERKDGIFISRVTLGSFVDINNLLHAGDEIMQINKVDITGHTLEEVASIMQRAQALILKTRSALPLPMHVQPLLKSYTPIMESPQIDASYNEDDPEVQLPRTFSDPYNPKERFEQQISKKRNRSRTTMEVESITVSKPVPEYTFIRAKNRSQNDVLEKRNIMVALKSPVFNLTPSGVLGIKIEENEEDKNGKSFSRAQRYQQKSPTFELDLPAETKTTKTSFIRSPRMFRKVENKKQNDNSKLLSIPSNDSLSSCSDTEENKSPISPNSKTQVYQSDSMSENDKFSKGFNGKLTVNIQKLLGRISNIDGDCYCTIEVDDEFKATTQPKKVKEVVNFEECFEIDIRRACVLTFYIFHKQPRKQHKLVSQACIHLEKLLANQNSAQLLLATSKHVQVRVGIDFTQAESYLQRSPSKKVKGVFGFNLSKTLVVEKNTIPLIVRKCVEEIELRGLDLVGIYRISGNARKKKFLRAQFEEDSSAVDVREESGIECHVLTGILKDYLRELPKALISQQIYLNIYNKCLEQNADQKTRDEILVDLMKKLPYTNRATLIYIMEHLQRVADNHEINKMNFQNLAVCFGPVLMCPPITQTSAADMFDFKKQIQALEFLFQIWPKKIEQNQV